MRILLCSYTFAPNLGGIETVSKILADEFCRLGATVTVTTHAPGPPMQAPYKVLRRPSFGELDELARKSDVAWQNNISLNMLPAIFAARKPVVVTHQTWITRNDGSRGWQDRLKRAVLGAVQNVAISKAIAASLPRKSVVIGNPFEPGEFMDRGNAFRTRDIVFVGRLVSAKGCDLALRSLAILKVDGLRPSFSIIGDGPEAGALKQLTAELGLNDQVTFLGAMREGRGQEVARHKVMVVPSLWAEPFGVVALEGLAAGCAVIASSGGGLPDAVGPCGMLFPNGDAQALAAAMKSLLTDAVLREELLAERDRHLEQFRPEMVARRYLEFFESTLRR
ncbi:MAG: glycosyltransferase family 4 protein [Terracidiphilus sp.]